MTEIGGQILHGLNAVSLIDPERRPGALPIAIEEARQSIEMMTVDPAIISTYRLSLVYVQQWTKTLK